MRAKGLNSMPEQIGPASSDITQQESHPTEISNTVVVIKHKNKRGCTITLGD